jgi:hypothetical protein
MIQIRRLSIAIAVTALACGGASRKPSGADTCDPCDMTGTWVGKYKSSHQVTGTFAVDLTQSGSQLGGAIDLAYLDFDGVAVSGTIDGDQITFGDVGGRISFSGTTGTSSASGSYWFPSVPDTGTWSANKVARGAFSLGDCFETEDWVTGLTHDGTNFWYATSSKLIKADASGVVKAAFVRPGDAEAGTVGGNAKLAFDGEALWYANGSDVFRVDASNPTQVLVHRTIGDGFYTLGLAWVNDRLWLSNNNEIQMLDGSAGDAGWVDAAVSTPGPMAYDGAQVWVIDNAFFAPSAYGLAEDGGARTYYDLPEDLRPADLAFDGQSLWLAADGAMRVCRLDAAEGVVNVSPKAVALQVGATSQFTATVNGSTAAAVTWSVQEGSSCGSVSASGLYTAPDVIPSANCHVIATSIADGTQTDSAVVALISAEGVSVSVNPESAMLGTRETQRFTATVTGTTEQGVSWSIDWTMMTLFCGSIDATGLYQADSMAPDGDCTVVATSIADPTQTATAVVSVSDITVTVDPSAVQLAASGQQQFIATVTGASNTAVLWSLFPPTGCGSVSASGLYTAPADPFWPCEVTATSVANNTKSAYGSVTFIE